MNLRLIGVAFAVTAGLAPSQTETALRQAFDVASIKPGHMAHAGGEGSGRESVAISPNGVTLNNASLSFCLQWAWNVRFYQVSGPGELTLERYDIVAKAAKPSGKEQLMTMMQALLADRFSVRVHRETRTMPVYELVARPKAPKLRKSTTEQNTGMSVVNGSFVFHRVTMSEFAERLSDFSALDRPVLDKTGLEGVFDITLTSAAIAMRE
ncbi:MAG: hypothetical protein QOJ99_5590, partial [Bryobacterales bacterium]|nr:hypothetical protein [Bryobacterales bacterium]